MRNINNKVLVLNKSWLAIRIETVKRAIKQIFEDKAFIVNPNTYATYTWGDWVEIKPTNGDKLLHISSGPIILPEVVVLRSYNKIPAFKVKLNRRNLLLRDGFRCQYTGIALRAKDATVDHVIPKSRGGKTSWKNVVIASKKANAKKDNRTPKEASMKLLRQPFEPVWNYFFLSYIEEVKESWTNFLPHNLHLGPQGKHE